MRSFLLNYSVIEEISHVFLVREAPKSRIAEFSKSQITLLDHSEIQNVKELIYFSTFLQILNLDGKRIQSIL